MDHHHYREASQQLRRVAQRNPKAADPQFWLGMLAVDNGFNVSGIRKYFTKCIDLCPNYPNALAHYYMGMIHYTDERYEEATAELETYFRMANNCDDKAQTAVYEEASAYLHWSRFLAEASPQYGAFRPCGAQWCQLETQRKPAVHHPRRPALLLSPRDARP